MALREILIIGDPVLTRKSEPIDEITEDIVRLAKDMVKTPSTAPPASGWPRPRSASANASSSSTSRSARTRTRSTS